MEKVKKILLVLIVIALIAAIVAVTTNFVLSKTDTASNPVVTMEVEGYGTIKIELYPDMAPNTVTNFICLAQRGYYDGKTFSEIGDGLVYGGFDIVEDVEDEDTTDETTDDTTDEDSTEEETTEGPMLSDIRDLADGEEDEAYSIEGEFIENGYNNNTLSHERGVISMYRTTYTQYQEEIAMMQMMGYSSYIDTILEEMYDSQGSGFFILTEDNTGYDGTYTAFGKVIEGMDVVDAISNVELETTTDDDGNETTSTTPVNAPVITSVTVETYGVDYGVPTTIEAYDFDTLFNYIMQMYMSSYSTSE